MRKTLLAAVITAATVLAVPAFAQLNLGGAAGATGRVGAGPGATLPTHTVKQLDARAVDQSTRVRQQTERTSRRTLKNRRALTRRDARANAHLDANASANASAAGMHRGADASVNSSVGLDTAAAAGKVYATAATLSDDARATHRRPRSNLFRRARHGP